MSFREPSVVPAREGARSRLAGRTAGDVCLFRGEDGARLGGDEVEEDEELCGRAQVSCSTQFGEYVLIFTAASPNRIRARKRPSKMGTGVALIHSHSGAGSSSKAVATPMFLCDEDI